MDDVTGFVCCNVHNKVLVTTTFRDLYFKVNGLFFPINSSWVWSSDSVVIPILLLKALNPNLVLGIEHDDAGL